MDNSTSYDYDYGNDYGTGKVITKLSDSEREELVNDGYNIAKNGLNEVYLMTIRDLVGKAAEAYAHGFEGCKAGDTLAYLNSDKSKELQF